MPGALRFSPICGHHGRLIIEALRVGFSTEELVHCFYVVWRLGVSTCKASLCSLIGTFPTGLGAYRSAPTIYGIQQPTRPKPGLLALKHRMFRIAYYEQQNAGVYWSQASHLTRELGYGLFFSRPALLASRFSRCCRCALIN